MDVRRFVKNARERTWVRVGVAVAACIVLGLVAVAAAEAERDRIADTLRSPPGAYRAADDPARVEAFTYVRATRAPSSSPVQGAADDDAETVAALRHVVNATNNVAVEVNELDANLTALRGELANQTAQLHALASAIRNETTAVTRLVASVEALAEVFSDAPKVVRALTIGGVGALLLLAAALAWRTWRALAVVARRA